VYLNRNSYRSIFLDNYFFTFLHFIKNFLICYLSTSLAKFVYFSKVGFLMLKRIYSGFCLFSLQSIVNLENIDLFDLIFALKLHITYHFLCSLHVFLFSYWLRGLNPNILPSIEDKLLIKVSWWLKLSYFLMVTLFGERTFFKVLLLEWFLGLVFRIDWEFKVTLNCCRGDMQHIFWVNRKLKFIHLFPFLIIHFHFVSLHTNHWYILIITKL